MLVKFLTTDDHAGRLDGFTVGVPVVLPEPAALRWITRGKAVACEEPEPATDEPEPPTPDAGDSAPPADSAPPDAESPAEGQDKPKPRGTRKKKS